MPGQFEGECRPVVPCTYDTDKVTLHKKQILAAPFGDECAPLACGRILKELDPTPNQLADKDFREAIEAKAVEVWNIDPRRSPGLDRGITFLAAEQTGIWQLVFGKEATFRNSSRYLPGGEPNNPAIFLMEQYYDFRSNTGQLALLAAHTVLQAAKYNPMVRGLTLYEW